MDRSEYITALRQYITERGMRPEDIEEAMGFYGDIIMESSQEDFERLGSVEKLGSSILAEYNIFTGEQGSFQMQSAFVPGQGQQGAGPQNARELDDQKKRNLLLILLVVVVTFPFWIGFIAGAAGLVIGIGFALLAIIIGLVAGGAALTFEGIFQLFDAFPIGLTLCGIGLVLLGLCGVAFIPLFKSFIRFITWGVKTFVSWVRGMVQGVIA